MPAELIYQRNEPAEPARDPYPNAYVAVPPNGRLCKITGLGHSKLHCLLSHGAAARHVRTIRLREPGAARGKFLFHSGDMLRWLDSVAAAQAQARSPVRTTPEIPVGGLPDHRGQTP